MKILQISDIHWNKRKQWDADFPGMKSRFLVDLKEFHDAKGDIDYVFICGDIAYKGSKDEYDLAKVYISEICRIIGCTDEQVFVVPGNHDLNRKAEGACIRELVNIALSQDDRNNGFLEEAVLGTPLLRESVYHAFEHYYDFSSKFFCQEEVMKKSLKYDSEEEITDEDKLFYQESLKKVGNFDVSIRGLNTALNCDEWDWNEDNPKGHKQFLPRRAYILNTVEKQEIRILLGHHPLEFLCNKDEIESYINNHYHIQFFGHVHEQHVESKNFVRVHSGAFDPPLDKKNPRKYRPVYNIVEITQKDEGHIRVLGESQIWDTYRFVRFDDGCFDCEIEVEQDKNKWMDTEKEQIKQIDARSVKFKFMRLDNRISFFDKIEGLHFIPQDGRSEYDQCVDFLTEVEKRGKLEILKGIIE